MGFNVKHNNAEGKYPEFGAIFICNRETKRECLKRGLLGLPSSAIQFVEQVKAGMILFIFEYEKRQLSGVFRASCDGAMNIVPNALTSSGNKFPAQVKFLQVWHCKPVSENLFRDAIRENYFSAYKFNFGLSEKQVYKLLDLFSKRKLEVETPRRSLTTMNYLKSECCPIDEVGRCVDLRMHVGAKDEQRVGANISPIMKHKHHADSLSYDEAVENVGYSASDIVVNEQRNASRLAMDTTSEYVREYLAFEDEHGYAPHEKEHYMDIPFRPTISGGYSRSPSYKIGVHDDCRLSMSEDLRKTGQRMVFSDDRLISEDPRKIGQRMVLSDDSPVLYHSDVNSSFFNRKPPLEHNPILQNHHGPISTMVHPIQAHISNSSCSAQGDVGSQSPLLYDPDAPGLDFSRSSPVRIYNGSRTILETDSHSNNCRRNSVSDQPFLMHSELDDVNRYHNVGYNSLKQDVNGSDWDMSFNMAWISDQLAAESLAYESGNSILSLKSMSAPGPPSDIGNSGRVHEPFSSSLQNYKSRVGNAVHPNVGHEKSPQRNNEAFTPVVPWINEGHSQVQYGGPLVHENDIEYYGNSQTNYSGHLKKKSSVFSRLSSMQDGNMQENGNNAWNKDYDSNTSFDEVMEMVHQSHNQWMMERKPKKLVKRNKVETFRAENNISTSKVGDCLEYSLNDMSMDLTTASGDNTNKTTEEKCLVDFKRRSKVRKLNDEIQIRSSNEREKSENVQQKRRKLIRPNFSKSTTTDDKGINLGMPPNLQVTLLDQKDVSESCCSSVQTKDNTKTDVDVQHFVGQTHSEDKSNLAAFNGGSECLEIINNLNAFSSASFKDESGHIKGDIPVIDGIKSVSRDSEPLHSIFPEHHACKVVCAGRGASTVKGMPKDVGHADKVVCAGRGANTGEGMSKDGDSSLTIESKDGLGLDCSQHSGNEKAPSKSSCHVKEGSRAMDSIKSVCQDSKLMQMICQKHHVDKVTFPSRGVDSEKELSKDGSDSLRNCRDENAPITTYCHKTEGLCTKGGILVYPDTQSPPSIRQEHHVDKVKCGRSIKTEVGMSKDGSSPLTTEVKDGSNCSPNCVSDDAPIATSCEQKMA